MTAGALETSAAQKNTHGGARPGAGAPPREDDWQAAWLAHYRKYAGFYEACRAIGVDYKTVRAYMERDPSFAERVEDARECFADRCERGLYRIGRKSNNPLAYFGLLKRHRPHEWHDKLITLNTNLDVSVTATPEQARGLLATMLGAATGTTAKALTTGQPDGDEATSTVAYTLPAVHAQASPGPQQNGYGVLPGLEDGQRKGQPEPQPARRRARSKASRGQAGLPAVVVEPSKA